MSSSQDLCECPKCKGIMIILDDYSTYETTQWCVRCGNFYDRSVVWAEDWIAVKDENGNVKYEEKVFEGGFGVLRFTYEEEIIENAFDKPLADEKINQYREEFESGKVKKEESYLILLVNGKFELIFGKPDEMVLLDYQDWCNEE